MATRSAALAKLSLDQLRQLTLRCGINRSGTKGTLIQRLDSTLDQHRPLGQKVRVLSIDLGIRNLAYSLLTPAVPGKTPSKSKAVQPIPAVHAWRPLALVPAAGASPDKTGDSDTAAQPDFSPASLADIALRLVQERLLPLKPTHVLIERQRFRSGGGAAVYEWTVRVNSLEAMLYATFRTLQGLGHWDGVVLPMDPKRVSTFLLEDEKMAADDGLDGEALDGGSSVKKKTGRKTKEAGPKTSEAAAAAEVKPSGRSARENKKRKIDLVGGWLTDKKVAMASTEAEAMRILFLERWLPKKRQGKRTAKEPALRGSAESIKKLDDVADSLMQGVAWLRWEENKTKLKSGGSFTPEEK